MSVTAAAGFSLVQHAPAYRAILDKVVAATEPQSAADTWLDVGCGPGQLVRAAAARGFSAIGVDRDRSMVQMARLLGLGTHTTYAVSDHMGDLPSATVVSATSLLCQVPDPENALDALWTAVVAGGQLLVLETTDSITPERIRRASPARDVLSAAVLSTWARARAGRALSRRVFDRLPVTGNILPLLDDCLELHVFSKPCVE